MLKRVLVVLLICMFLCSVVVSGCGNANTSQISENSGSLQTSENDTGVKTESRGIPGSHYQDARLGLEQNGFPAAKLGRSEIMNCRTYENIRVDSYKEVSYDCSLFIEQDSTVINAEFGIVNNGPIPTEDFLALATAYMKYCASIPYDTADIEKVTTWVEEEITTVGENNEKKSIRVGDAEFTLYGTKFPSGIAASRLIEINKIVE